MWAVTLIGGLFITVLSFILIMTVYGRFFKLYMYTALAPIPLSTFAGEATQNVGKSFIKSYCAVLLEGAVIVLACIIFSVFASSPPVVNPDAAAVTQVWAYIGELVFNMLVLVGADLIAHFGRLGSECVELETDERLRIFHDFYRVGEESSFHFDIKETRKNGHDFKDYICPDTMEFEKDYFKMGNRYGRVLFLREYASYIKDSMVAELTDMANPYFRGR